MEKRDVRGVKRPSFRKQWEDVGAHVTTSPCRVVYWFDELKRVRFAYYPDTLQYTIALAGGSKSWKLIECGRQYFKPDPGPNPGFCAAFREYISTHAAEEIARVVAEKFPASKLTPGRPIPGVRGRFVTIPLARR